MKGAYINVKDKNDNNCPIIAASRSGNVEIIQLLLSKGANPNDKDNYGNSPIIAIYGHDDLVNLLLTKGSSIPSGYYNSMKQARFVFIAKWPLTMAVIVLRGLFLYHNIDASSLMDLSQYVSAYS